MKEILNSYSDGHRPWGENRRSQPLAAAVLNESNRIIMLNSSVDVSVATYGYPIVYRRDKIDVLNGSTTSVERLPDICGCCSPYANDSTNQMNTLSTNAGVALPIRVFDGNSHSSALDAYTRGMTKFSEDHYQPNNTNLIASFDNAESMKYMDTIQSIEQRVL